MQILQRLLARVIFHHRIGILQFPFYVGLCTLPAGESITLRFLWTWQRWLNAASPACLRTVAATALPPSRINNRGVEKSTPRSTSSLNKLLTTAVFSVAPSRSPSAVLRPSQPMPRAKISRPRSSHLPYPNGAHTVLRLVHGARQPGNGPLLPSRPASAQPSFSEQVADSLP
jgi:hypothetical protein